MDLSLKKPAAPVSQDLPEDLSLKKPRGAWTEPSSSSAGNRSPLALPVKKGPRTSEDRKIRTPPDQYPRTPVDHKIRTPPDQYPRAPVDHKIRTPPDQYPRAPVDHKIRMPPDQYPRTPVDHKIRTPPDQYPRAPVDHKVRTPPDHYPRTGADLKPRTLAADQSLRTLAHQKAKTLAGRSKRTAAGDPKPGTLVVPKPSALIIPDPRNRTLVDQRNRTHVRQSGALAGHHKPRTQQQQQQQQPAPDTRPQQGLDLRKQLNSSSSHAAATAAAELSPRTPPSSRHRDQPPRNDPAAPDNPHTFLYDPGPSLSNGFSSSSSSSSSGSGGGSSRTALPLEEEEEEEEEDNPSKRRRKQECPRKRIKLDSYLPEEVDPAYLISQEFLDKVTDAAHNGQFRKGLDAYFGGGGDAKDPGLLDFENGDSEEGGRGGGKKNGFSDFAQNSLLAGDNGEGDEEVTNAGSSCSSASPPPHPGSPSPFYNNKKASSSSSSSPSKRLREARRLSASLQNREKRKALRLYGKAYTTPSGKNYPQRQVRDKDCSKCRYNCSTNISPDQRQAIFEHFWSLDSYVKRLYYYCQSIKEKPAKTMKHTRECSREYTFLVERVRVRVCKGFYLATLDVSDKAVRIAMEKRKRGKGMWDKRGSHPPHNKTRPEDKDRVRNHIESFLIIDIYTKTCENSPTTPGQDLNVTKMHQDYVQECQDEGREPVSEDVYRKTFNTEYNLTTVQV